MQKSALSFSCLGFWNFGWVPCSCTTFSTKLLSVALGNQHSSSSRASTPGGLFCRGHVGQGQSKGAQASGSPGRAGRPHTHISSPLALLPQLPTYKDEDVPSSLPPKSVYNLSRGQWTSVGDVAAGAPAELACCCPLVGGTSNITKMSHFLQRNSLLCADSPRAPPSNVFPRGRRSKPRSQKHGLICTGSAGTAFAAGLRSGKRFLAALLWLYQAFSCFIRLSGFITCSSRRAGTEFTSLSYIHTS